MRRLMLAGAVGAAVAYFFDPQNGRRRRKESIKRTVAFVNKRGRRAAGGVAAQASAVKQKATHRKEEEKAQPDDVTLARKVETEIFRDADVPKGKINVNVEDGVVYLRGELEEKDLITDLEDQARKVQGVLGVENLLHAPGEPAPVKPE
jgi:osmotically-inducible protein OsmY